MAYAPMSYTTGNWTVNEGGLVTPTTTYGSGTKTVTITNWNPPSDLSYKGRTADGNGFLFVYTNNVDTECNRAYVIKVEPINDVYERLDKNLRDYRKGKKVDVKFQTYRKLSKPQGVQIMCGYDALDKAANSVSAEEGDLYCHWHAVGLIMNHPAVTATYIGFHLGHFIGSLTEVDKTSLSDFILAIMRGDLDPTR